MIMKGHRYPANGKTIAVMAEYCRFKVIAYNSRPTFGQSRYVEAQCWFLSAALYGVSSDHMKYRRSDYIRYV